MTALTTPAGLRWPANGHEIAAAHEIAAEHGALTRQVAGLQRHLGEQLQAQARRMAALEDEVLRLRAQLVVARTCMLWGLGAAGVARRASRAAPPPRPRTPQAAEARAMAEADRVICQTGCVGHAHPWLDADGVCRRTGAACAQVLPLDETDTT